MTNLLGHTSGYNRNFGLGGLILLCLTACGGGESPIADGGAGNSGSGSSGNSGAAGSSQDGGAGKPVVTPAINVDTIGLPEATTGDSYSAQLIASGGDGGPYTWELASGSLPDGLTLSKDGVISGTVAVGLTTTQGYDFKVIAIDSSGKESPEASLVLGIGKRRWLSFTYRLSQATTAPYVAIVGDYTKGLFNGTEFIPTASLAGTGVAEINYSPDGQYLYAIAQEQALDTTIHYTVYLADAHHESGDTLKGTKIEKLVFKERPNIVWAPDSKRFAISSYNSTTGSLLGTVEPKAALAKPSSYTAEFVVESAISVNYVTWAGSQHLAWRQSSGGQFIAKTAKFTDGTWSELVSLGDCYPSGSKVTARVLCGSKLYGLSEDFSLPITIASTNYFTDAFDAFVDRDTSVAPTVDSLKSVVSGAAQDLEIKGEWPFPEAITSMYPQPVSANQWLLQLGSYSATTTTGAFAIATVDSKLQTATILPLSLPGPFNGSSSYVATTPLRTLSGLSRFQVYWRAGGVTTGSFWSCDSTGQCQSTGDREFVRYSPRGNFAVAYPQSGGDTTTIAAHFFDIAADGSLTLREVKGDAYRYVSAISTDETKYLLQAADYGIRLCAKNATDIKECTYVSGAFSSIACSSTSNKCKSVSNAHFQP